MAARKIYYNSSEKQFFVKLVGLTWFLVRTAFSEDIISPASIKATFHKEKKAVEDYLSDHFDELNILADSSDD